MSKLNLFLFLILFAAVTAIGGIHGYWLESAGSLILLTIFLLSGLIFTSFLFEDRWLAILFALPVGYVFHSVVLAVIVRFTGIRLLVGILYIAATTIALVLRRRKIFNDRAAWNDKDVRMLWIWLALTVAIIAWPLMHVGAKLPEGYAFRAYFNADYFKHLGITGTISQTGIPPHNPYLSGHTLNYYWFFYVIPAIWNKLFTTYHAPFLMIQFTVFGALMFVTSLFATLQHFTKSRKLMGLLLPVFAFGGSYEGLYAIHYLRQKNFPISRFTNLNIDGLTRWFWQTPQIDTLFRALLYAPQHLLAVSMGLLALVYSLQKERGFATRVLVMGLLFSTLGFAAIIGAVLIAGSIVLVLIDFLKSPRRKLAELLFTGIAGVVFLVLYFPLLQMFRLGPEGEWLFGLIDSVWKAFPRYLILNFGVLLLFGLAGIVVGFRQYQVRFSMFYLVVCLFCMLYIQNRMGGSEVTLKLGYICNVSLLILTAALFVKFQHRFALLMVLVLILTIPASVSWVMDVYNSQDYRNRTFATIIPSEDQEVYEWMNENLPADAIVQYYCHARETLRVTPIPSFAQRSVYVGDLFHGRAFQVEEAEFQRRQDVTFGLFHLNTKQSHSLARKEGIQYLFVSARDTEIPEARYQLVSPFFSTLFQNGNALLVRVNDFVSDEQMEDTRVLIRDDKGNVALRATFQSGFFEGEQLGKEIIRWMGEQGKILVTSREEMKGDLGFTLHSFERLRNIEIQWNGENVWSGEVSTSRSSIVVPVKIRTGENHLTLRSLDSVSPAGDRSVSVRLAGLYFVRK